MGATRSRWKTNGAQRITHSLRGYWRQRADDRFGDPPPKVIQEPLVVRDRETPRGPSGSALLLCV